MIMNLKSKGEIFILFNHSPIVQKVECTKPNKSIYSIVFAQSSPQIKLDDGHRYMNKLFEAEISENPKEYSWEYKKFRRIEENKDLYNF